jgi:hypothetical protein
MTVFARDLDTGMARWGMQMTPHDEWDYDGINEVILFDKGGKTYAWHHDRNGFAYTWVASNGTLVSAEKVHPFVNWSTAKISHLSIAGVVIQDNTVVTVSGMVRFPDNRTSDVVCGLPYAVISAYKQQCGNDGSCTYEEADEYTADVLGYFEISVTPGESYLFHASYGDHSICYSEDGFDAECSMESITTMTLGPSEDTVTTNSYVVLEAIDGSESIVFYDTTERTVDVGLYAGVCGTSYEGYTMLITPANGCGAALSVTDTDISGWTLTDTSTPNIRYWPYAAMDY